MNARPPHLHRRTVRPPPLGRARRRLPRAADDRARRDDRERRAALDPARPRLQPGEPDLGRQRLPGHVRQPAAAGRAGSATSPGRKRVFLAGVVTFTVASLLCGIAPSEGALIGARLLQGVGAAAQASVILAIIVTEFPEAAARARAMSAYVFVSVAGGSLGLLAGGLLTEALSWHWVFFVNLPIGIATFALGQRADPRRPRARASSTASTGSARCSSPPR